MIKRLQKLAFIFLLALSGSVYGQSVDFVETGANYANDVWYSLENGIVKTQPRNDWDISFHILTRSAGIHINQGPVSDGGIPKAVDLYLAGTNPMDWATIDTAGKIKEANRLNNSDTSWATGAFNQPANLANLFDYGWGLYDAQGTQTVDGTKIFFVKLRSGQFKKILIQKLDIILGQWIFRHANLDNTADVTDTLHLAEFPNKSMVYYSLENAQFIDRAPVNSAWDLLFTRYVEHIFVPADTLYVVGGVLQNHRKNLFTNAGVTVAQVTTADTASNDYQGKTFTTEINTIGSDWKNFDFEATPPVWVLANDRVYFVKDQKNEVYKLVFIDFGGQANGRYTFRKSKVTLTSVDDLQQAGLRSYAPSPADRLFLIVDCEKPFQNATLTVTDLNGRLLSTQTLPARAGVFETPVVSDGLPAGVYILTLEANGLRRQHKALLSR